MIRKIIQIDEERCNGCSLCAQACHEGAIAMVDGVAKLMRDDYCDGLGDCLPVCPTGAIAFVEREAAAYDEVAVQRRQAEKTAQTVEGKLPNSPPDGCPGKMARSLGTLESSRPQPEMMAKEGAALAGASASELRQWPVQIQLAPVNAPYFEGARLLIAADCAAYACGSFHQDFMRGRVALIGCPKLDEVDYADKLTEILMQNDIRSLVVVRMEVPCCAGIVEAVRHALTRSGKTIPWQIVTLSLEGGILDRE